jgi:hypothetical protein
MKKLQMAAMTLPVEPWAVLMALVSRAVEGAPTTLGMPGPFFKPGPRGGGARALC